MHALSPFLKPNKQFKPVSIFSNLDRLNHSDHWTKFKSTWKCEPNWLIRPVIKTEHWMSCLIFFFVPSVGYFFERYRSNKTSVKIQSISFEVIRIYLSIRIIWWLWMPHFLWFGSRQIFFTKPQNVENQKGLTKWIWNGYVDEVFPPTHRSLKCVNIAGFS